MTKQEWLEDHQNQLQETYTQLETKANQLSWILSVIIQVVSFKTTGKRVFRMAPIHHHFEMLGWSEQQVVLASWFCGFLCGVIGSVIGVL